MKNPKTFLFLRIFFLNFPKKKFEKILEKKISNFFRNFFLDFFFEFFFAFSAVPHQIRTTGKKIIKIHQLEQILGKCSYAGSMCPRTLSGYGTTIVWYFCTIP